MYFSQNTKLIRQPHTSTSVWGCR